MGNDEYRLNVEDHVKDVLEWGARVVTGAVDQIASARAVIASQR